MKNIVVIGASGAIGSAFVADLVSRGETATIHALARSSVDFSSTRVKPGPIDLLDENAVAAAAEAVSAHGPIDMVLVATGLLHDGELTPEKSLRDISADNFGTILAVNTVGPALVMKHFLPRLNRQHRTVFAALSARVGSISDNHLGGWYAYRASKAALNMLICNAAIETARRLPQAIVVGLHPGTVDSDLSKPFQGNIAPDRLFSADHAAGLLLDVITRLNPADSGKCFAFDGSEVLP